MMPDPELSPDHLLRWYLESGVDECIGDVPVDRFAASAMRRPGVPAAALPPSPLSSSPAPASAPSPPVHRLPGAAAHLAAGCATLSELRSALDAFDALAIRQSATSTVFADGNPQAAVMCIGEAPGAEEDRQGRPFAGAPGRLLDRMLASIGLDRSSTYLTSVLPWRLPANRRPTPEEVAACLPFVTRHIDLVDPQVLILFGEATGAALLARHEPLARLRGRWFDYSSPGLPRPVPALVTFTPAYLIGTPEAKRHAWRDLLMVKRKILAATH